MAVKDVLKSIDFSVPEEDEKIIREDTKVFLSALKSEIEKKKISAVPFLGGSFAKGTLAKKEIYDVDIFMRFDWKNEYISDILEGLLKDVTKKLGLKLQKLHGSRDYFRIGSGKYVFEVIPVMLIRKPREARNVTDLSYFHVNYVKKKVNGTNLGGEIALAKRFCEANKIYGAESYIQGFSGYAIECLVIHYKSFEKMLKELSKVKERIILDPEKLYKKKEDVLFEINESKLHSPVILVDPTWKERNVLAALSQSTFEKFQEAANAFLKRPSKSYFEKKKFDIGYFEKLAKKRKGEVVHVKLKTDRQEGDVAGTKMKKFSNFLGKQIGRYFEVLEKEFEYAGGKAGDAYYVVKSRGEVVKIGPPSKLEKHAAKFKKENKKTFEKNGLLHAKVKVDFSANDFVKKFVKENKGKVKEMAIVDLKVQ